MPAGSSSDRPARRPGPVTATSAARALRRRTLPRAHHAEAPSRPLRAPGDREGISFGARPRDFEHLRTPRGRKPGEERVELVVAEAPHVLRTVLELDAVAAPGGEVDRVPADPLLAHVTGQAAEAQAPGNGSQADIDGHGAERSGVQRKLYVA